MASWRQGVASARDLWTRLRWALLVAIVTSLLLPFVLGRWSPLIAFGLFLAAVDRVLDRRSDRGAALPPIPLRHVRCEAGRQHRRVVRHGDGASRGGRVHRRRDARQGLWDRAEPHDGQRADRERGRLRFYLQGRRAEERTELLGRSPASSRCRRDGAARHAASRKTHLQRQRDRRRRRPRSTRASSAIATFPWANLSRTTASKAHGRCACTSSPSSTGSGADAS